MINSMTFRTCILNNLPSLHHIIYVAKIESITSVDEILTNWPTSETSQIKA